MAAMAADEFLMALKSGEDRMAPMFEKIFAAAQPGVVFSPPVSADGYTVITASEVAMGGGFGSGFGIGPTPPARGAAESHDHEAREQHSLAGGGGIGGGGGAQGRPVAAIVIGPDGVTIKPIVDVTKIALAAITAWGAMGVIAARMFRGQRPAAVAAGVQPPMATMAKRLAAGRRR